MPRKNHPDDDPELPSELRELARQGFAARDALAAQPAVPPLTPAQLRERWQKRFQPTAAAVVPFPSPVEAEAYAMAARTGGTMSPASLAELDRLVREMKTAPTPPPDGR